MSDADTAADRAVPPGRLTIGQVAAISGVPATTLRYYEQRGLLRPPDRVGGQRRYRPDVVSTLMVIRFCRVAGLSLDEVAVVLGDRSPGRSETRAIAHRQVERIEAQLDELRLARDMMTAAAACACPTVERCDCGAMADVLGRLRDHLAAADPPG